MPKVLTQRLTETLYVPYVRFLNAVREEPTPETLESFRRKVETGWYDPAFIVIARPGDGGDILADLQYVGPAANEYDPFATLYYLAEIRSLPSYRANAQGLQRLLAECVASANPAARVHFLARVDCTRLSEAYDHALRHCGFRVACERVEFRTRIADMTLASEGGLRWRNGAAVSADEALELYARSNAGKPAASRFDLREHFLQLADRSGFRSEPDMLQVGYLGEDAVAIILLTLEPVCEGWCTMLFVGVVPEHHGKGIGRLVHSHGIRILKDKGGLVYHDGTESTNAPMLRVFHQQGCRELCRMVEYERFREPCSSLRTSVQ
jgi:GNAT superfamily N-acetyltransferase